MNGQMSQRLRRSQRLHPRARHLCVQAEDRIKRRYGTQLGSGAGRAHFVQLSSSVACL